MTISACSTKRRAGACALRHRRRRRDVDQARRRHHARRQRAIRLAASVEAISLCGVERRRPGHHPRHQARRHRVPHRSGVRRAHAARRARGAAVAAGALQRRCERANICSPPTIIPSNITVHRIQPDGTLGEPVRSRAKPDVGIFAHQVLTTPGNQTAILVTRGNNAEAPSPEDPGALKVYGFKDGVLTNLASIAARQRAWLRPAPSRFSSDAAVGVPLGRAPERASRLSAQRRRHARAATPLFIKSSLADRANHAPRADGRRHPRPSERPLRLS